MDLLRTALGSRAVSRIILSYTSRAIGIWMFTVVVALYAYEAGGASAVGLAGFARLLPSIVAAPYGALLADRVSRRTVLISGTAACSVILLVTAAAAAADLPVGVVIALAALCTTATVAHVPAQAALLPQVAGSPSELAAANVCLSAVDWGGFLVGSLLAGLVVEAGGAEVGFAVAAVPFALATVVLFGVSPDARPEVEPGEEPEPVARALTAGVRTVAGDPALRFLIALFAVSVLAQSAIDVLIIVTALDLLEIGESGVGWLSAVWGAGGVLGGVSALVLLGRGRLAQGLLLGFVLSGVPLVALGFWPELAPAIALFVVLGVGFALVESGLLTLTQRLAPDDVIGRVFGVQETLYAVMSALGALLASGLVAVFDADGALIAAGLLLPIAALAGGRRLVRFEGGARVPEKTYTLLRDLPLFAPLPVSVLETLALRARPHSRAAGETIITQGEQGDRFYVIASGEVDVYEGEEYRRSQGPGAHFGEIALLRDVPRTATVRAKSAVGLLALDREEFLAGIGAHARSARVADRVADDRLAWAEPPG